MEIALVVEKIFGIMYLVVGISMLMQKAMWLELTAYYTQNMPRMMFVSFFPLLIGLIIVFTHNIWVFNLAVIVTIVGWLALIKGVLLFLAPQQLMKLVPAPEKQEKWIFYEAIIVIILSSLILVNAFFLY